MTTEEENIRREELELLKELERGEHANNLKRSKWADTSIYSAVASNATQEQNSAPPQTYAEEQKAPDAFIPKIDSIMEKAPMVEPREYQIQLDTSDADFIREDIAEKNERLTHLDPNDPKDATMRDFIKDSIVKLKGNLARSEAAAITTRDMAQERQAAERAKIAPALSTLVHNLTNEANSKTQNDNLVNVLQSAALQVYKPNNSAMKDHFNTLISATASSLEHKNKDIHDLRLENERLKQAVTMRASDAEKIYQQERNGSAGVYLNKNITSAAASNMTNPPSKHRVADTSKMDHREFNRWKMIQSNPDLFSGMKWD